MSCKCRMPQIFQCVKLDESCIGYHPEKLGQFSNSRKLHETPIYWVIRHGEFHDKFSFFFKVTFDWKRTKYKKNLCIPSI